MKRIVSVMLACIMALALLAGCGSKGSGKKISFEGTDLNGNTVTSSEIFGNNKVTMVNLWSSTCKGCEDELAQLQDLGDRVAGAGGQVIGVIMDTDMDNAVEKCSAKLQSHVYKCCRDGEDERGPRNQCLPADLFCGFRGQCPGFRHRQSGHQDL